MDRVTTGIPRLDQIVGGGIPANSVSAVAGLPGTGKTVLAQQFVFANATPERRAVYLTTLSEPRAKLIRYLQQFTFYDEDKLFGDPPPIYYQDIAEDVKARGFDALPELVAEILHEHQPAFLVIDPFKALRDLAPATSQLRQVLFGLAGTLAAYACTTLLLGEYSSAEIDTLPEFAVVDGILHLVNQKYGVRDERYMRVTKLRGSSYLSGEHAFRITDGGLQVYPRLVTPPEATVYSPIKERASTGLPELDAMMEGGLWRGSSTLVAGPAGSGKTILGLHFLLDGVAKGEPSLLASFQENTATVAHTMASLGHDPAALAQQGHFVHLYSSPVEMNIDDIIGRVIGIIEERGIRRLVIDSLGDLEAASWDKDRFRSYVYSMIQYLSVRNITAYVVFESPLETLPARITQANVSYMSDNVLALRYAGETEMRHTLAVLKSRGSGHDPRVREFTIDERGINLATP